MKYSALQRWVVFFLLGMISLCTSGDAGGQERSTTGACFEFLPGLCPGPSSCMCTLFEQCGSVALDNGGELPVLPGEANDTSAEHFHGYRERQIRLHRQRFMKTSSGGECAGECRQVLHGACPGGAFCLVDNGPCQPVTPSPIVPNPTFTPSPVPPSFVGMVRLPNAQNIWIDQYEASVEYQVKRVDGSLSWALHPFNYPLDALDLNATAYRAVSPAALTHLVPAPMPQAYISQVQARTACLAANKRLCYLAEYMAACSENTTFPYGNVHVDGACNEGNPNPVITVYGKGATFNLTEMNNPILDTLPHTLAPSGSFTMCTNNVTGTFDMSGNLDEWVSDQTEEGHGIFKGGYFVDALINGPGCRYMTVAHAPTYHDYSLGFRCCYGSG